MAHTWTNPFTEFDGLDWAAFGLFVFYLGLAIWTGLLH